MVLFLFVRRRAVLCLCVHERPEETVVKAIQNALLEIALDVLGMLTSTDASELLPAYTHI